MYIGRTPVLGNFVKLDAITTSATATYNLLNGGVAYFPQTANNCIVSLNGVIQSPTSAYTISGSTIVFSDALTSSDTIDFILVLGDVLSIGTPSDGTITSAKLASGTDGLFAWQSVQTTGFTAVAARAYPCNTTSSAFTVTLPASPSVGDQVAIVDYAGTFATNAITLSPNGLKINGSTDTRILNTTREGVTLTYVDSTQGWVASSGVNEGTVALAPAPYSVDFLVLAGGGSGGRSGGGTGGAGAGGYRSSNATYGSSGRGSSAESSLSLTPSVVYTITVGAGGSAQTGGDNNGNNGSDSSISGTGITTITSTGGGGGGRANGVSGGCGSGGGENNPPTTGGSGTANQGYDGGAGRVSGGPAYGGGGGGTGQVGATGPTSANGGNGTASTITGSSVTRGGGGGGSRNETASGTGGTGGGGNGGTGAGPGSTSTPGINATANTGGGGGGVWSTNNGSSGTGGSGVVILRMATAKYTGTTTGSPTVSTSGSDTILVYNASGSYTA